MRSIGWRAWLRLASAIICTLGATLFGQAAGPAHGQEPSIEPSRGSILGEPTPIEDPSGRALAPFHAALHRAQVAGDQARIVFYGASHVASDLFTGALRQRLQLRFGEAGAGFVLPAEPWRFYRNAGVHFEQTRGFVAFRIKERAPQAGVYGLAGAALDARRNKPAIGAFTTRANGGLRGYASRFELYYMKQPGGGHLTLSIDGQRSRRVATAGKRVEAGYESVNAPDGPHRVELRTAGDGPVRVFGLALERDRPGVILDTLGIPGTRARDHLYWDDVFYREHLARRRASLIVLAYGTNESGDDDVSVSQYEADLRRVVERARAVTKGASCLLIGPSDRPLRDDDGSFEPRPLTDQIIDVQRRVSIELGCGFFDLRRFMGGPMSMLRWVAAEPAFGTPDYVHFTQAGYERLASVLYDALVQGFEDASRLPDVTTQSTQELPRAAK